MYKDYVYMTIAMKFTSFNIKDPTFTSIIILFAIEI